MLSEPEDWDTLQCNEMIRRQQSLISRGVWCVEACWAVTADGTQCSRIHIGPSYYCTQHQDWDWRARLARIDSDRHAVTEEARPCAVYVMATDTAFKVGMSFDPCARRASLDSAHPTGTVRLLGQRWYGSRNEAALDEARIHDQLSAHRIKGEWYRMCDQVAVVLEPILSAA